MTCQDDFNGYRETRWCLDQVARGYETYESMVHLITLTPEQERYLYPLLGPSKTAIAVKRRQEILQRFKFHLKHASSMSE